MLGEGGELELGEEFVAGFAGGVCAARGGSGSSRCFAAVPGNVSDCLLWKIRSCPQGCAGLCVRDSHCLEEADKKLVWGFFPPIFFCKLDPQGTEIQLGRENVIFKVLFISPFC